jgi:uncharacterized protein
VSKSPSHCYLETALRGVPLSDVFILDAHAHYGHWGVMHVTWPDFAAVIRVMDRIGINMVIVNGVTQPDYKAANRHVSRLIQHYPGRVIGSAVANPFYQEDLEEELNWCLGEGGFKGIKIHEFMTQMPFSSFYNPRLLEPIFACAAQKACPVLCHGLIDEAVVKDHPRVNFIWAHGPMNIDFVARLAPHDNFHIDTAYSIVLPGTFEFFVKVMGPDRILFGSDVPYSSPAVRLGQVLAARLRDEEIEKILGRNAARLYGVNLP